MKSFNMLITAASRRVALVKYFRKAIHRNGNSGRIIAADTDPNSPALYFTDNHHLVPLSSDPDYIPTIMGICKKENIRLIVPTIDEELPLFGGHREVFAQEGIIVLISPRKTGEICLDKYTTANFFLEKGFPFAPTYLPDEVDPTKMEYPLFIKPRTGRGSVGAFSVEDEKELRFFMDYVKKPIIQTFLEGDEYTIDVLCSLKGEVLSVVPRKRMVIRSGVCDRGMTVNDPNLISLAAEISKALNIIGPANLQCKVHEGKATFFEVNPRFSGAIQLSINAGANFPEMIVDMVGGEKVKPALGAFQDKLTMISYEDSIYRGEGEEWPHREK